MINKQLAKARAVQARQKFGFSSESSVNLFEKLQSLENFTIVFMPFEGAIDGFSNKRKNHYIIILNSNRNNNRKNFTCAHELYHLLFEYENDIYKSSKNSEEMANAFASYFLVPSDSLYLFLSEQSMLNKDITVEDIVKIENHFKVSRQAILIRMKDEGLITEAECANFSKNVIESVKKNNGNVENYCDFVAPEKKTIGEYERLANELLKQNKITRGKYQEYILDAFNYQSLFGGTED